MSYLKFGSFAFEEFWFYVGGLCGIERETEKNDSNSQSYHSFNTR